MNTLIKTALLVLSFSAVAGIVRADEGDYYSGFGPARSQSAPASKSPAIDLFHTGSIAHSSMSRASTSRDNRIIGDEGDYYEGVGPR
ncbi:hypothetical protein [Neorhizobium galegae]|uniref:hypothetical protein n=1 Tax=Neorhizobium galegae TaxID=399 RepID=UPI001F36B2CE|nr:hypothetical protein [Neorhizobium galegae]MCQ1574625.1 hypothetical protein [Neorhizobium galegae]UIK04803.1 hypothetical protein LZK81_19385 [Neorhizobium galegae]